MCVFVSVTGRSSTSWLDKGVFVPEHDPRYETHPLSALISNLKHHEIFVRKLFGNRVIMQANTISFKPRLCLNQLDSPRIGARQEIFQEKRGVCFNAFARHERSARKIRRKENWQFVHRDLDSVSSHRTPPLFAPIRKESFTTRLMQLEATVSPLAW